MSAEAVQFIIGRAVTNPSFRDQLQADPDGVVAAFATREHYEFTGDEVDAIRAMDWQGLTGVAHDLDQRISRARISTTILGADEETCGCVKVGTKDCTCK